LPRIEDLRRSETVFEGEQQDRKAVFDRVSEIRRRKHGQFTLEDSDYNFDYRIQLIQRQSDDLRQHVKDRHERDELLKGIHSLERQLEYHRCQKDSLERAMQQRDRVMNRRDKLVRTTSSANKP
jgi:hypothetical protein